MIKLFDGVGDTSAEIVDDNRNAVHDPQGQNRGLLGLELDPEFPTQPYVYALYTRDAEIGGEAPLYGPAGADFDDCVDPPRTASDADPESCPASGRLERLELSPGGAVVDRTTLIDDWCVQFETHSVGALGFGASGALYASAGEGADYFRADYGQVGTPANACGDPDDEGGALRAQDVRTAADETGLGGSVIRVDPATGNPLPDNPGDRRCRRASDRRLRAAQPVPVRGPARHRRALGRRRRLGHDRGDQPAARGPDAQLRLALLRGRSPDAGV